MIECLKISTAFLTPLIAVIAAYVAYQQYMLQKRKLNFDLFDRRLEVYKGLEQILWICQKRLGVKLDDYFIFRDSVSQAKFIFELELVNFLEQIEIKIHNALRPEFTEVEWSRLPQEKRLSIFEDNKLLGDWAFEIEKFANAKFDKYLRIFQ